MTLNYINRLLTLTPQAVLSALCLTSLFWTHSTVDVVMHCSLCSYITSQTTGSCNLEKISVRSTDSSKWHGWSASPFWHGRSKFSVVQSSPPHCCNVGRLETISCQSKLSEKPWSRFNLNCYKVIKYLVSVYTAIYLVSKLSAHRSANSKHSHGHSHSVCSTRWQLRHIRSTWSSIKHTLLAESEYEHSLRVWVALYC